MDWQIFWLTFSSILVAEIGDKTQISVLSFSASSRSPLTVFIAASLALIAATLLGVLAGSLLSRFIQPKYLKTAGGILFIIIGVWTLFDKD